MSDYNDPYALGALPTARLLGADSDGYPEGAVGNVCVLPRATPKRVATVRNSLPEIADENLDRSVHPWRDIETGQEYELIRGHLDVIDPASSNAVAFVISDGWIVGLRPAGHEDVPTSVHIGNMRG